MSGTSTSVAKATLLLSPKGEQSRLRILRAATEVLAETGELEVAVVAVRANVSDGLPYRYFGSRSGLLAAMVDDFHRRLADAVVHRSVPGATWQERERTRVSEWVRFLYEEPVAPVMLSGLGGDETVAASWQRQLALAVEMGARNILRGQRDGDLPPGSDPTILAAAVLGGVHAGVATALARRPRPSQAKVAESLWHFVRGAVEFDATSAGGRRTSREAAPTSPARKTRRRQPRSRARDRS